MASRDEKCLNIPTHPNPSLPTHSTLSPSKTFLYASKSHGSCSSSSPSSPPAFIPHPSPVLGGSTSLTAEVEEDEDEEGENSSCRHILFPRAQSSIMVFCAVVVKRGGGSGGRDVGRWDDDDGGMRNGLLFGL